MTQLDFNFSFPENPYPEGTQYYRVWEFLREHGAVTTKQLHNHLCVDTARIRSDVRPKLRKNGMDYKVRRLEEGNWLYTIIRKEVTLN